MRGSKGETCPQLETGPRSWEQGPREGASLEGARANGVVR